MLAAWTLACAERRDEAPLAATDVGAWLPGDDECGQCHAQVADEWARSRHHTSFTNPDFQRAYARETTPFCRECHAPEHARLPAAEAEARGVGCLACHRDGDAIATGGGSLEVSAAPHALRRDPGFATRTCARCHEFEFPPTSRLPRGTMMQTTMREHRASAHADRSCADCHMPRAAGSPRHDFASTRDPAAMRRALDVRASRDVDALRLELRAPDVGHAFPTGDLFRRLAIHATLVAADGRTIAHATRYLARHFVSRRHPDGRLRHDASEPLVDDRLHGAASLRVDPGARDPAPDAALVWWIDLERVDELDRDRPGLSTIADTIRLAEGRLPPASPSP